MRRWVRPVRPSHIGEGAFVSAFERARANRSQHFGYNIDEERGMTVSPRQTQAALQAQLAAGFRAARRPGLAAIVGTSDFNLWMKTESGWRPTVISPPVNQGHVNGGLFQ